MKDHYVTYDQAVKLKELGFDEKVNYGYSQKMRIEPDLSYGNVKEVHSKEPKNFNDNRKGIAQGIEFYSAPRLDQAQAWLREVKGIDIEVTTILRNPTKKTRCYMSNLSYFGKDIDGNDCGNYIRAGIDIHSYEKALELGIDKALELLTNQPTAI